MFLEKFSRFFRRYHLTFQPRHKGGAYLPLDAPANEYSIRDALRGRVDAELALEVQSNGDVVELMDVSYRPASKALVLLFHRASPNAAEPAYRKKARLKAGKKVTVRQAIKEAGEEQSVSAHLVVFDKPVKPGVFGAALEEIPGISMGVIRQIIAQALAEYQYEFKRKKEQVQTYSVVKADGLKSETLTNALKAGEINFVTLVRPAKPDFVDAGGIFQPVNETMRLRVNGEITSDNWRDIFDNLVTRARAEGWEQFNVDIDLPDKRSRTVRLERDQEAKEILFVRSEQVAFSKELSPCSVEISGDIVAKALTVIQAG